MTGEADVHDWLAGQAERVIETSCAWVFLSGARALKVKKPVDMGFLDFTTPDKRRWALERELAFNHEYSPDIYSAVQPISRTRKGRLELSTDGEIVDWALEMRRFPDDAVLSFHPDRVDGAMAEALGRLIARSHIAAPVNRNGGGIRAMGYTLSTNAEQLRALGPRLAPDAAATGQLIADSARALEANATLLNARAELGFARRCHGDLHLGNILIENGSLKLFDCIEFNDTLSEIDTLYDFAFLVMDLDFRGRREAANRALNGYLDEAARGLPDSLWNGLAAFPLMLSARAAVRSHVAAHSGDDATGRRYFAAAGDYLRPTRPRLFAIGGLSGTGKTTLARALAPRIAGAPGAVILRSDEIRKRLWSVGPLERLPPAAYKPAASEAVHREMFAKAATLLRAGRSVVLDATFIEASRRDEALSVALTAGVPFQGVWLERNMRQLHERLEKRRDDASDATTAVLDAQQTLDPGEIVWPRLSASDDIEKLLASVGAGDGEGDNRCTD